MWKLKYPITLDFRVILTYNNYKCNKIQQKGEEK